MDISEMEVAATILAAGVFFIIIMLLRPSFFSSYQNWRIRRGAKDDG